VLPHGLLGCSANLQDNIANHNRKIFAEWEIEPGIQYPGMTSAVMHHRVPGKELYLQEVCIEKQK
jgi:hypothetical protein